MAKPRVTIKRGHGTIIVLTLLFFSSAGLRIFSSAGEVLAQSTLPVEQTTAAEAPNNPSTPQPSKEELNATLAAFQAREARIERLEQQITRRMKALKIAEETVSDRLEQLRAAEDNLRSTLALASTAAEDDLVRLTSVYENMKPKTASALFEEMAPDFAAGFLGRMRTEAAAAIMAGMTPAKAYSISAILAGRNADVPTE